MKKFYSLFLIFVICLVLVPFNTKAEAVSETLAEAAAQEGITFNHPNYTYDESKPNVYLFRGHGCSHCYELIEYLETIIDEYGKYFNLVSYEVWYNSDNSTLMSTVASVLGDNANGVPYLVIGDQTFIGYRASTDAEAIKKAVKELSKSSDRYDVMDHLDEAKLVNNGNEESTTGSGNTRNFSLSNVSLSGAQVVVYITVILVFAATAVYVVKSNNDMAILKSQLYTISDQLEELSNTKSEVKQETKKVIKKTVKKSK